MIAQGLPIAAALFLLFPRLASPLWGLPADHAARTGPVRPDGAGLDQRAVAVRRRRVSRRFRRHAAAAAARYWRGPVLSRFDGREWRALSPRPGGTARERQRRERPLYGDARAATIIRGSSRSTSRRACRRSTPIPARAQARAASRGYSRDQQLLMRAPVTQPLRYSMQSTLRDSYAGGLGARNRQINSRAPRRQPAHRRVRAMRCARDNPDDRRFISAVLQWFRDEPFVYTLAPPLLEDDPVDMFLFDTRRGFCEHYASAFVVMLRAAGIPARVVTGYQGGEINPRGGYMIVRQSDAHAWAEAIIDGRWQRFDPTAAVAPSRVERGLFGSVAAGEPVPLFARQDGGWLKDVQLARRRDQPPVAPQRHPVQSRPAARAVARMEARPVRAVADRRWRRRWRCSRGRAACSRGSLRGASARSARSRCGTTSAAGLRARACRDCRTKARSRSPVARRLRWPQFEIAFRAIGESFAALRYGTADRRDSERLALHRNAGARDRGAAGARDAAALKSGQRCNSAGGEYPAESGQNVIRRWSHVSTRCRIASLTRFHTDFTPAAGTSPDPSACRAGGSRNAASPGRRRCCPSRRSSVRA